MKCRQARRCPTARRAGCNSNPTSRRRSDLSAVWNRRRSLRMPRSSGVPLPPRRAIFRKLILSLSSRPKVGFWIVPFPRAIPAATRATASATRASACCCCDAVLELASVLSSVWSVCILFWTASCSCRVPFTLSHASASVPGESSCRRSGLSSAF